MIKNFQFLKNIGQFRCTTGGRSLDLEKLTLIYAENGRGKTTLAAVLRSLASGNASPVLERQRLGVQDSPYIVLNCEGSPSNVIFQNGAWNRTLPEIRVFDDIFVDENVYSGLDVESRHRQNLHELILGDQGVVLNRALQGLVSRNDEHNEALAEKARLLPEQIRGGLSVDEFLSLPEVPDIENKIAETEQVLRAARNQDAVRTTNEFNTIDIPTFDIEGIRGILLTDLPGLDEAAAAQVMTHIEGLGEGGEPWVAEGVGGVLGSSDGVCPFCGQSVEGLELINHYRTYFGQSYSQLKSDVAEMLRSINDTHSSGAQVAFERVVGSARQLRLFWANYCDVPPIELDTESIAVDWNAARESVAMMLSEKQAAPLDRIEISQDVIDLLSTFDGHRLAIDVVNDTLTHSNEVIRHVKEQVETASSEEILTELNRLKATRARFSDELALICEDYLQEKHAKACTETARAEARNALDNYRTNIFPTLQSGVNNYLRRFNASFRIDSLTPSNIARGSGSSCTYNVVINNEPIAVRGANSAQGEHSFRNSLSAGDRNTLALALFFSSLDQNPDLADAIIVIDDPMSSLDDHRSLTTIQTIRSLCERVGQVIVLSHNKRFLCSLWDRANKNECLSLEIGQNGEESTIRSWNVSQDAITEHDQRDIQLREYATSQNGDMRVVATAIRPHLESFLRVACSGKYPPGKLLGQFAGDCTNKLHGPDEILDGPTTQELKNLIEYGNLFHHDTNPAWQTVRINGAELLGFVHRTLAFVGPPKV